jgi:ribulose 1,5-bisphosphate carboxylase large subunit-like protein
MIQVNEVGEYAEEHQELKTALTKWGTGKTGLWM